jgi:SAM-dependent methyltransferase
MGMQALQAFIFQNGAAAAGLAAVGAALDARASGVALDPGVAAGVEKLLAALGANDVLSDVRPEEAAAMLGIVRFFSAADAKLLRAETRTTSWDFSSPDVLQGVGSASRAHAHMITREAVPVLEGLAERLRSPGCAFLDVGVGVAGLAIAVAQMWPEVRVVGLDPWQPSVALARRNIDEANLRARIEVREQGGETLADESAFDLAWLAATFIREPALGPICERTLRALRPGAWVVLGLSNPALEPPMEAAMGLRLRLSGDPAWSPAQAERLLRDKGYVGVRTLPASPGSLAAMVAGRRAPA